MRSTATQIAKIISATNPSAPITTHALAELGNGSMQNGLKRIVNYFAVVSASNLTRGKIQGGLVGALGTAAIAGGIALACHLRQKKQLEAEGKIILDTLQKPAPSDTTIIKKAPFKNVLEESDTDCDSPAKG